MDNLSESPAEESTIKQEDLASELFFIPGESPPKYEIINENDNKLVQTGPNYQFSNADNALSEFLVANPRNPQIVDVDGDGEKIVEYSNALDINGKGDAPNNTSHFVKYKPDANGKTAKVWECGICNKEFAHQYILMRHLPTHTDERKFICKQCGKAFRQMSTLSQHRAIHSKLRPYVCEICQKTFNRISTLISHRKTHSGTKPHRCHLCNKAFHQKGNLRNHIFTHTNERPYKCDVCQKGFNQMSNLMCHKLKAHQRVEKPRYDCATCGKEFDKRTGLRNHEQYAHSENAASGGGAGDGIATVPNVKYTNGVIVPPINTVALREARAADLVPFALFRPLEGTPALVRVLPAGDQQLLVPATADDIKKYGEVKVKMQDDANTGDTLENSPEQKNILQLSVSVVATVVQCRRKGVVSIEVIEPGPTSVESDIDESDEDAEDEEEEDNEAMPRKSTGYGLSGGLDILQQSMMSSDVTPNEIEADNASEQIFDSVLVSPNLDESFINLGAEMNIEAEMNYVFEGTIEAASVVEDIAAPDPASY